jgi:hypothetical protein
MGRSPWCRLRRQRLFATPMRRSRRSAVGQVSRPRACTAVIAPTLKLRSYLGKLAQIDERLFAQAISLFCYKGIATGAGLIDLIAGTSVLNRQHALQRQLPTLSDGVVLRVR